MTVRGASPRYRRTARHGDALQNACDLVDDDMFASGWSLVNASRRSPDADVKGLRTVRLAVGVSVPVVGSRGGDAVGSVVGEVVGEVVGSEVGGVVGSVVGCEVGGVVGSLGAGDVTGSVEPVSET